MNIDWQNCLLCILQFYEDIIIWYSETNNNSIKLISYKSLEIILNDSLAIVLKNLLNFQKKRNDKSWKLLKFIRMDIFEAWNRLLIMLKSEVVFQDIINACHNGCFTLMKINGLLIENSNNFGSLFKFDGTVLSLLNLILTMFYYWVACK